MIVSVLYIPMLFFTYSQVRLFPQVMALNSQIDRLEAVETQLKNTNSALKADNADFQVRVA